MATVTTWVALFLMHLAVGKMSLANEKIMAAKTQSKEHDVPDQVKIEHDYEFSDPLPARRLAGHRQQQHSGDVNISCMSCDSNYAS